MTVGERGLWMVLSTCAVGIAIAWRLGEAEQRANSRALDIVREHFDTHEPVGVIAESGW